MLDAAVKALAQMFTPPFRSVLARAVGLALLILVLFAIALHRLFGWLAGEGALYLEGLTGPGMQSALHALLWVVAIAAGLGLAAGAIFLMPAVSAFVATFFSDEIAARVEQAHYPADAPGTPVPAMRAGVEGLKTAGLAFLVYLGALPLLLFAGLGVVVFFLATAYLLGREYFLLAAMRFRSVEEAKALRREYGGTVLVAGMFIAAFVSIPILNLATPLFGTAFMTHMHKRIAGRGLRVIAAEPR